MRGWRFFTGFCLAILLGAFSNSASAEVPQDEAGFTAHLRDAFAKAMPDYRVTIIKPLVLSAKRENPKDEHTFDLGGIFLECLRVPTRCDMAVAVHVMQMSASSADEKKPFDRANLRVELRLQPYVDIIRKAQAKAGTGDPVAVPFMTGLWVICVYDLPTAIETVNPVELKSAGLSPNDALFLGTKNLADSLPPLLSVAHKARKSRVGIIGGSAYESGRLLLFDSWAPLVKRMKGKLLVSIPSPDLILYAKETGPEAVDEFFDVTQDAYAKAPRQLTSTVFRWTEKGWQMAKLGTEFVKKQ